MASPRSTTELTADAEQQAGQSVEMPPPPVDPSPAAHVSAVSVKLPPRVSAIGITPLSSNVQAIMDYPQPTTTSQLRWFLGLVNFYHRFVPHCADILQPLHSLLSAHPTRPKSTPLMWTPDAEQAFASIKTALADASLLNHPHPTAEVCLMTDASLTGVGGVLQQRIDGAWQPLSFFSRKLTPTQQRYYVWS